MWASLWLLEATYILLSGNEALPPADNAGYEGASGDLAGWYWLLSLDTQFTMPYSLITTEGAPGAQG